MRYPDRKYTRLKEFDYAAGGTFCMTICTKDKAKTLGRVVAGENAWVALSPLGEVVKGAIERIPEAYPGVEVLNQVVMPNHVHILLQISYSSPISLFDIVRSTKSMVSRQWGESVWQRSFFEHIVRGEQDALRYWKYIDDNPRRWVQDPYFE